MRTHSRPAILVVALAALAATAITAPVTTPPARAAAPSAVPLVVAGADYATRVFSDPWDYSNPSDLLLDNSGPAMSLSAPVIGDGVAAFTISRAAYVSPLWAGYPGSLRLGRDGARATNMLDAGTYTRMHLRIYATAYVSSSLQWFTCGAPSGACIGGMPVSVRAGWNDIDLAVKNNPRLLATGKAWAGKIQGVRFAMNPRAKTTVKIDFLRLYQPSASATLDWASPNGHPAQLWASDGSAFTPVATRHAGPVPGATSANANGLTRTNVAGYPPSAAFYAVASNGTVALVGAMREQPRPVIDSPSAVGCGGYNWTFPSVRKLAGYRNATALSFTSYGRMSATNAGPRRNDPHMYLPIRAGGISGRTYHRLTIVEAYNGAFGLRNAPGGGTMARIMWLVSGRTTMAQTADIVTYSGKRTITIDMAMPAVTLTESDSPWAQRYAFATTRPVTRIRWDPNEDPGSRRWHVYSIRLAADCSTSTTFAMTWRDLAYVAGSQATIYALPAGGAPILLGTVAQRAGTNAFTVRASALPAGAYTMRVDVSTPNGGVGTGKATGPLVIRK